MGSAAAVEAMVFVVFFDNEQKSSLLIALYHGLQIYSAWIIALMAQEAVDDFHVLYF